MKKLFKILLINLFVILCLLAVSEAIFYFKSLKEVDDFVVTREKMNKINNKTRNPNLSLKYNISYPAEFNYQEEKENLRKPVGLEYKKHPIIIFGCSFAYGDGLYETDTVSYKLSKLTKRPVYNRAKNGWGPQHILYQLNLSEFYKEIPNADYIIYIMMGNHDERMFRYQYQHPFNVLFLRYKLTKNGFEIIKPFCKPAWALYTVNAIQEIYLQDYIMSSYRQKYNNYYYIQMMKEIYRLAKEHYPNVKFAILNYRNIKKCFIDEYDMKKELENIGYILIDTNEIIPWKKLSKQEFKTIDNAHPNGKAWDVLLPEMVIKLNIK